MADTPITRQETFIRLGTEMTACTGRSDSSACPGVAGGRVTNAPERGIHPRGLFLVPNGAIIDQASVVVVSQNPGAAGLFERWANRLLPLDAHRRRFEESTRLLAEESTELRHYERLGDLLRLLWDDIAARTILFAEVVYCQTAKGKSLNGKTYSFCGALHLERQLELVGETAIVICAGAAAAKWFSTSHAAARLRWVQAEHPSGSSRCWGRLISNGKLEAEAAVRWKEFIARSRPPGMRLLQD